MKAEAPPHDSFFTMIKQHHVNEGDAERVDVAQRAALSGNFIADLKPIQDLLALFFAGHTARQLQPLAHLKLSCELRSE